MKDRIKRGKKYLVGSLIFLSLIFTPVLYIGVNATTVATVSALMTSLKESVKESLYNTELNAPFSKATSGVRETVSTETGAMRASNTILSIPGRTGMDLDLILVYSNQNAKLYDEGTSSAAITPGSAAVAYYDVYKSNGYWLRTGALQYAANATILASTTVDGETWVFNGYLQYSSSSNPIANNSIANTTQTKSMIEASKQIFGVGWSLDLPSLVIDTNSVYVTLSNGQTYLYDSSTVTGLKDYGLSDVSFGADVSVTNGTDRSAYKLRYSDGTTQYFTSYGEILQESDRFGNHITYYWTECSGLRLLTKIVDSGGRIITLDYNDSGATITYGNKTISLLKTAIPGATGKYCLSSYVDADGNATAYSYSFDSAGFDLLGKTAATNIYANLSSITYQTGFRTSYTYTSSIKNLGGSGSMSYFKVSKRWDSFGSKEYSSQEYFYSGEPDGYPTYKSSTIPMDYSYSTKVCNEDAETVTYLYNYKHLLYKTESVTDVLTTTVDTQYDKDRNVPTKEITTETVDDVSYKKSVDTYEFDNLGNLVSENHPVNPEDLGSGEYVTTYSYDSAYNVLTGTSYKQNKNTTITTKCTLSSDKKSISAAETYTNGALTGKTCYEYDSNGNLLQSAVMMDTDSWSITQYTYGHYGLYPTSVICGEADDENGSNLTALRSSDYTYEFYTGNVLTATDGNGNTTSYSCDVLDRKVKEVLADGSFRTTVYDDINNTILTTDAEGGSLLYAYDQLGNLIYVQKVLANEIIAKNSYDTKGNLTSSTDANGNVTAYTYDALDRVLSTTVTDNDGVLVSKKFVSYEDIYSDNFGSTYQRVTITTQGDTSDLVKSYYYNGRGQLVKESRVSDYVEQSIYYSFDYLGNVLSTIGYDGAETTYTYDASGNVLTTTDANGNTTGYQYDMVGNQIAVTNALGVAAYTNYNAVGSVTSTRVPQDSENYAVTKYYYDSAGNMVQTVDAEENVKKQYYDERGFLTAVEQVVSSDENFIVKYEYDREGRQTAQYTGLNSWEDTSYSVKAKQYDDYGNLVSETDATGAVTTYNCDGNGNLIETTDRNGITTYYKYDGLDRLLQEYNSRDGEDEEITYIYDLNGALKTSENKSSAADYTYDGFGRVTEIWYDTGTKKEYTYDDGDRVISLKVTVGGVVELYEKYEYDAGGRKNAVVYEGVHYKYEYDAANQLVSETNGLTGAVTVYTYTKFGAVKSLSTYLADELIDHYEYQYDLLGNQTEKNENGLYTTYTYDALSRLKTSSMSTGCIQIYSYDDYSNIESMVEIEGHTIAETLYYYDEGGRLVLQSCEKNGTENRFEYDDCGNLIHEENVTKSNGGSAGEEYGYTYNGYNQLSLVTAPDGEIYEYTYDCEGLRNAKISSEQTIGYICVGGYIIIETDADGKVTAKNVWGIHLLLRDTDYGTYSYLFNGHGDITALTDEHGNVLEDYAYDPYGNDLNAISDDEEAFWHSQDVEYDNPFRYCGEYLDLSSGTYYLRARYYDPTIGRFLSEDTYTGESTDPLSLNLYTYCKNNPIMFIDPSGHIGIYNGEIYMDDGDTWVDYQLIKYKIDYANTSDEEYQNYIAGLAAQLRQDFPGEYRVLATQSIDEYYIPDVTSNLQQFVADRTEKFANHWGDLLWFRKHVDYGAEVDLKENSMFARPDYCYFVAYDGSIYRGDMPGNFAYGYLGKSALFPNTVLYVGAGVAQQTNANAPKDWTWIFTSYGDAPGDRAFIDMGINYYYSVWGSSGYIPAPQPGPGPGY